MRKLRSFLRDTRGTTAMEYALIGAGVSIVIVTALMTIGTRLSASFTQVSGNLS